MPSRSIKVICGVSWKWKSSSLASARKWSSIRAKRNSRLSSKALCAALCRCIRSCASTKSNASAHRKSAKPAVRSAMSCRFRCRCLRSKPSRPSRTLRGQASLLQGLCRFHGTHQTCWSEACPRRHQKERYKTKEVARKAYAHRHSAIPSNICGKFAPAPESPPQVLPEASSRQLRQPYPAHLQRR